MSSTSTFFVRASIAAAAAFALLTPNAFAQLNSTVSNVVLNATLAETLTIAATPGIVNFTLVSSGVAAGSAPVVITTTWVLGAGRANVILDASFLTASAALSSAIPISNIPSSSVLGQVTTGTPTTFTQFTSNTALGTAAAGLTLFTQPLTVLNRAAVRIDSLNLEISTVALPQLPATSFTGTLILQAQAL